MAKNGLIYIVLSKSKVSFVLSRKKAANAGPFDMRRKWKCRERSNEDECKNVNLNKKERRNQNVLSFCRFNNSFSDRPQNTQKTKTMWKTWNTEK